MGNLRRVVCLMAFITVGAFALTLPNRGTSELSALPRVQDSQQPNNLSPTTPNSRIAQNSPNDRKRPDPSNPNNPNNPDDPNDPNNPNRPTQ